MLFTFQLHKLFVELGLYDGKGCIDIDFVNI